MEICVCLFFVCVGVCTRRFSADFCTCLYASAMFFWSFFGTCVDLCACLCVFVCGCMRACVCVCAHCIGGWALWCMWHCTLLHPRYTLPEPSQSCHSRPETLHFLSPSTASPFTHPPPDPLPSTSLLSSLCNPGGRLSLPHSHPISTPFSLSLHCLLKRSLYPKLLLRESVHLRMLFSTASTSHTARCVQRLSAVQCQAVSHRPPNTWGLHSLGGIWGGMGSCVPPP